MKDLVKFLLVFVLALSVILPLSSPVAEAKQTSYLMNTKKLYTYKQGAASDKSATSYTLEFWKKSNGYNHWSTIPEDSIIEGFGFGEHETKDGLYTNDIKILAYPVKKGKSWKDGDSNYEIRAVNWTITTPVGTFKNVIEVRETLKKLGYRTSFYAPGVGLVLETSKTKHTKGKTITDLTLVKLKNK
ncbi:hypothetical protein [Metabacillus fastidiosus]|uniref:GyrI-like small molecule binding domain-containing protein n=1 Tax=Metabacillus fastidiosus TaxID=1458 RepID=A0ABU6P2S5_9BACI|nr:hypothetical protein [Metabacillus fastidiosus]MED4402446.1 hypothetical protein [Metabacillus fastidiosus]MED4453098.1 hypothetical protein [Metabacillus fastidiosus]MED4461733.1 hypothetical protein [Metabacillus fastidiosus]